MPPLLAAATRRYEPRKSLPLHRPWNSLRRVPVSKKAEFTSHRRFRRLDAVRMAAVALLLLLAGRHHASKLVLAGELAAELAVGGDQLLADGDDGLLGRQGAVRLDSEQELRHIRVSD